MIMPKLILVGLLWFACGVVHAQESTYTASKQVAIHFQEFGQGYPVLIVNGGPGFNSQGFSVVANKFAELGFKAILFDQRGTGQSTLPKVDRSTITMDLMVEDMEQIRRALGVEKWIIFGHSFGGMLASYYTAKHPERVKAMVLSSSGGIDLSLLTTAQENIYARFSNAERDSLSLWRRQYSYENQLAARKKYNKLYARAYVYDTAHVSLIADRLMEGDLHINRLVWNNLQAIHYDCKVALSQFCNPVLIIQGKQDLIPIGLALKADSVLCRSTVTILNECGHYGWVDQPDEYWLTIADFLNEIS